MPPANDPQAHRKWILQQQDPRKIQEFLNGFILNSHVEQKTFEFGRMAIEILLAESAERSSLRLEKQIENLISFAESGERSSKRLIFLTWALVIVSAALLSFAFVQTKIMLKEDANAHAQQVQSSQAKPNGAGQ